MSLYVKETGKANAPSIIFLHGGGASGWTWDEQVAQLSDFRCLVVDLPEHGKSIGVEPFTFDSAAAQIVEIIRAHGGKAHVVGLSLGAQTIVTLLSIAPELQRYSSRVDY